jgi:hypothetical protein
MDIKETERNIVDLKGLPQDRDRMAAFVYEIMNLNVLQKAGKMSIGYITDYLSSSGSTPYRHI